MTSEVRSCRPGDTLASAAIAMCEADCRFLPVVDEAARPVAVITDGDVCLIGSTDHRRLRDIFVSEAMSGKLFTCRPEDGVRAVLATMTQQRIRHLPVVNGKGLLVGVVSLTDFMLRAAEAEGAMALRREFAAALRAIAQKVDGRRIRLNPFVED